MRRISTALALIVGLAGVSACAHERRGGEARAPDVAAPITWANFEPETFDRARAENKLILIDVVAEWCHWCHVMDEKTYASKAVRRVLEDDFIVIRVEADARPDVAERYIAWGWPATAILTPDARPVMELRGYQPAGRFASLLRELAADHARGEVTGRRAPPPPTRGSADLEATRTALRERLDRLYDVERGGWGFKQKYPVGPMLEHALLRSHAGEDGWRSKVLQTLEGTERLIDPVWGGIYQYSVGGVWDRPHFEKITKQQALTIDTLTMASLELGDPRWLENASTIADFMDGHMLDPRGGYWAARDADLREGVTHIEGRDFYALDDASRRALGEPHADKRVFAELNGLLLAAFARHAGATGAATDRHRAESTFDALAKHHRDPRGLYRHAAGGDGPGDPQRYLADQASVLWGLLALHELTGDPNALDEARTLADATIEGLGAPKHAGFYAVTEDPEATGIFAERRKPLEQNALMARSLLRLHHLVHRGEDSAYRRAALGALHTASERHIWFPQGRFAGTYLMALEEALRGPIVFTVVSEPGDAEGAALASAVLRIHEPRRILQRSLPGEIYPARGGAALYLCSDNACSAPVRDPGAVAAAASQFDG